MFRIVIVFLLIVFVSIYFYLKLVVYSYFKKHKIPHIEPTMIIGNIPKEVITQKITFGMGIQKNYDQLKNYPFHGIYMLLSPVIIINDAELIKNVLIKDFQHFCDRGLYYNEKLDPVTSNLFFLPGDRWKVLRTKFTVFFTPKKIKSMFSLLTEISDEAMSVCNENLMNTDIIDVKDFISRYTADTICTIFFGFNSHCLRDSDVPFRHYGNMSKKNRPLVNAIAFFAPKLLEIFRMPFLNAKASAFFINLFQYMITKRQKTKEKRNDFVNFMIKLMEEKKLTYENCDDTFLMESDFKENTLRPLSLSEATAQAFAFFVAGFESSSTTMSYFFQEIAENPEIQDKLHKEIDDFLASSDEINGENLNKLEYLDMVWKETMRKHPVLPILNRICVKDYKIENSDYCIQKGMRIMIPVYGIHKNPDIYPDPEKFDPTRFDKNNTADRDPCYFLPFGIGPRYCIAQRMAVIQSKLILFNLLSKYKFTLCDKSNPITYSRASILHTPTGGVYLRIQKRKY